MKTLTEKHLEAIENNCHTWINDNEEDQAIVYVEDLSAEHAAITQREIEIARLEERIKQYKKFKPYLGFFADDADEEIEKLEAQLNDLKNYASCTDQ